MKRLLVLSVLVACGCGAPEAGLRGSLGNFYDLRYDSIRTRLYPGDVLSVEYVRVDSQVPVRLTFAGPEVGTHDLAESGDITGRVNKQVLPRPSVGNLTLTRFQTESESRVSGTFEARFDIHDDTGTLNGEFDAQLEIVDDIDGYAYSAGGTE